MKHARELFWHYWLPVLGMLTLINLESTEQMSGRHTYEHLQFLLRWLGFHLPAPQLELLNLAMRKCGHAVGYGLLCFCWFLLLRGAYWLQHDYSRSLQGCIHVRRMWWRVEWAWLAVFCTFAVAASDELHQMQIPGRTGTWWDVGLDTCAGTIAVLLVWGKAVWLCQGEQVQN